MPLLEHTTRTWLASDQLTNTAFSGRIPSANINLKKAGDPQFPCPKCHKVYTWKANLNRHLRLECGKKPHLKCPYCTYITNRKTSVQEHIRRRHKDLPNIVQIFTQGRFNRNPLPGDYRDQGFVEIWLEFLHIWRFEEGIHGMLIPD